VREAERVGLSAFVLAGGKSSRMGRDKALLEIAGETLIERTVKLAAPVTSTVRMVGGAKLFESFAFEVIEDGWPGAGPLGGIATALRATETEWNLILACDLPYLTAEWLAYLAARAQNSGADAIVPLSERGPEPLCAVYRKRCAFAARGAVEDGRLRVQDFIAKLREEHQLETVEPAVWNRFDSGGRLFKNMNEPADYEEAKAALGGRAKP
jgi:molybdenum cofactor guanylyltransferase